MTETWDFLESPAADAATNMAVDEALLRTAIERGRPLLRIYSWLKPAVSIGYFQKYPEHLDCETVRRPTGGGLVYHGEDTTYTIVAPANHRLYELPTTEVYCAIHEVVAASLGLKSEIADFKSQTLRASYECFQNPVRGDVMVDGRKVAGAAQRRTKWGLLHQGSIAARVSGDQLCRAFGVEFVPYRLAASEQELAAGLAREKYATDWRAAAVVRLG